MTKCFCKVMYLIQLAIIFTKNESIVLDFPEHLYLITVNSQIQPALEYNPLLNTTLIKTQFFFSKY